MKRTVKYTAFATDKSGQRVHVEGQTTFDDTWVSSRREVDVAHVDLQRQGYRGIDVTDTTVTDG